MPSFFRSVNDATSADESSSTSDEDVASDIEQNPTSEPDEQLHKASDIRTDEGDQHDVLVTVNQTTASRVMSQDAQNHSNMILHALLEDKCLSDAVEHFNKRDNGKQVSGSRQYTKDDPEVKAFAATKYRYMSESLGTYGLIAPGLHKEEQRQTRQDYRRALDYLSTKSSADVAVALEARSGEPELRKSAIALANNNLVAGFSKLTFSAKPSNQNVSHKDARSLLESSTSHLPLLLQPLVDHPLVQTSRYQRDFTEVCTLGKGGYGTVYRAMHRLDGVHYALKKISLNPVRIQKIHDRGQLELDRLLNELRTIAHMDHPNIVRYYNGWIEYSPPEAQALPLPMSSTTSPRNPHLEYTSSEDQLREGPSTSNRFHGHVLSSSLGTSDYEAADNVLFENTDGDQSLERGIGIEFREDANITSNSPPQPIVSRRRRRLSHATVSSTMSKRSTIRSVGIEEDDEEVEMIPRGEMNFSDHETSLFDPLPSDMLFDHSLAGQQSNALPPHRDPLLPTLTLHIQMSLYPLTLADFISRSSHSPQPSLSPMFPTSDTLTALHHCFHKRLSIQILLLILAGVEYLHSTGIVHRDLKPGNIFLSAFPSTYPNAGCIRFDCHDCNQPTRNPIQLNVRIGDFGLVTAIARPDDTSPVVAAKAVGTEFYRPPVGNGKGHANEKLDVFALGVVLFEMLWRFGTRMERYEILTLLKKGSLPSDFRQKMGEQGRKLEECILGMVREDERERLGCKEVRGQLEGVLKGLERGGVVNQ
ncbi:kinase-like protein [Patellaria atrata CBS 101060]|uniref:Kinase-like protein n=1 Tax=Patellaria atrata CBS 101060 TaxID=1346257 RepID=A0A9P4SI49_9PEZI|nr:kinase-like protein [Patellaria atrata CBS 101060]